MRSLVELDRRAVRESVRVVESIPDDHWKAPTPCSDWTLDELLAHMTAHHRGFAAAAAGSADPGVWRPQAPGPDPRAEYAAAAAEVLEAFARDGVTEREFALPEVRADRLFPGTQALSFHFVDYVIHAWDVAAAIGAPVEFDAEVVDAALEVVEREVPVGPHRERPGASFAPPVAREQGGGRTFEHMLAMTGRSPEWTQA